MRHGDAARPAPDALVIVDEADKEIPETEYNRLYQLTPGPGGKLRTVRLTSVP